MPRKAYPFWLILLALCLILRACSQPTPTVDNQAATPTLNIATTRPTSPVISDTGLSKGTLKEIFPGLANLPEQVQAIHIRPGHGDMGTNYQFTYDLQRDKQGLVGLGLADVEFYVPDNLVFESSRAITLSTEQARQFVTQIIQTPVEEGLYKTDHSRMTGDDYPSLSIEIETEQGSLLLYSASQKSDFSPWAVSFAGRNFIAQNDTLYKAYQRVEAVFQTNKTFAQIEKQADPFIRVGDPPSPPPVAQFSPLKPGKSWKVTNSYGESGVNATNFNSVNNLWAVFGDASMISNSIPYSYTRGISFLENSPSHGMVRTLNIGQEYLDNLIFSPDGKYLAASYFNRYGVNYSPTPIYVWEVSTGRLIAKLEGHERARVALAFSGDGKTLVSASTDRTVRVWSIPDGKNVLTLRPSLPDMYGFLTVAISPDGRQIAAAGRGDYLNNNFPVKVWQLDKSGGTPNELTLKSHKAFVTNLAFSADGQRLFSVDHYGNLYQWNTNSGEQKGQMVSHQDSLSVITSLSVSQDGKQIATGHVDGTLRLWSATDLKLLSVTTVSKLDKDRWFSPQVFFSQDGRTVITCDTATGAFAEWSNN